MVTWNVACIPGVYGDLVIALEPQGKGYDPSARFASNPWAKSDSAVAVLGESILSLEKNISRKQQLRKRGIEWAASQTWDARVDEYEKWLAVARRRILL